MGTPDNVAPPEWESGPATTRERVLHVGRGGPALVGLFKGLVALARALTTGPPG